MRLRRGEPADVEAIARIEHACYTRMTYLPPPPAVDEYRRFLGEDVFPNQEIWVAEDGGRVVAWASMSERLLEHIAVDPDVQNRGIGTALLAKVMELMPNGFSLWTFQKNQGARRFYERHGFRAVEFTDGRANMQREPDVRFEWRP